MELYENEEQSEWNDYEDISMLRKMDKKGVTKEAWENEEHGECKK